MGCSNSSVVLNNKQAMVARKGSMHHPESKIMSEDELKEKALVYHEMPKPGKFTLIPTKKMDNA